MIQQKGEFFKFKFGAKCSAVVGRETKKKRLKRAASWGATGLRRDEIRQPGLPIGDKFLQRGNHIVGVGFAVDGAVYQ